MALGTRQPGARRITPNISLLRAADGSYSVQLRRDERDTAYWSTITRVQEVGWDGGGVLVYGHGGGGKTGWIYAYDVGRGLPELMKSWGTYSRKEFRKRAPELHVQDLQTMPPARAWQRLTWRPWPFGG